MVLQMSLYELGYIFVHFYHVFYKLNCKILICFQRYMHYLHHYLQYLLLKIKETIQ